MRFKINPTFVGACFLLCQIFREMRVEEVGEIAEVVELWEREVGEVIGGELGEVRGNFDGNRESKERGKWLKMLEKGGEGKVEVYGVVVGEERGSRAMLGEQRRESMRGRGETR